MLHETAIIAVAFAYLGILFAIAYYADERADAPVILERDERPLADVQAAVARD